MIIRSLRDHWPARKMEWVLAGFMSSLGLYVLFHPQLFTQPVSSAMLAPMAEMSRSISEYPALVWGGFATSVGLSRLAALFVNGAYVRTPLIRLFASFASMFILTQIFLAVCQARVASIDIIVYPWLIIADLISTYRAAIDVAYAEDQRQKNKGTGRYEPAEHVAPAI